MCNSKIILSYEGKFNLEKIETLLFKAKKLMDEMDLNITIKKKIFNIMVECMDNINKHEDNFEDISMLKNSYFDFFKESEEIYWIRTKNTIKTNNIEQLTNKINYVNSLDRKGLRRLYEVVITTGELSPKGGAGLGLIDIAIKSANKLKYSFETLNDEYKTFLLEVKVINKKK